MNNLFESKDKKDFFVWVDPEFFLADHNLNRIGSLISTESIQDASPSGSIAIYHSSSTKTGQDPDNLMFIPNPSFSGFISPFQANLLWKYKAEYNLELSRRAYFPDYPSRLVAVFLFETEAEAKKYYGRNQTHVGGRELKHVRTIGKYKFSQHDSSWVDFLRLWGMLDSDTINSVCDCYWKGDTVEQCKLSAYGKPWTNPPIFEVLLLGKVDLVRG